MKIEKLTENKIRVLVNSSDLDIKDMDITIFLSQALEDNLLLSNILKKANDEIGFNTDGCRLLIEYFFSSENVLVFTITKHSPKNQKKKLRMKKSQFAPLDDNIVLGFNNDDNIVFRFNTFEDFCLLCERIDKNSLLNLKKAIKNISLFLYNDTYYLLLKNIDISYNVVTPLICLLTEFATPLKNSFNFESKLLEHGKLIIKNNAIMIGIKYFVSS